MTRLQRANHGTSHSYTLDGTPMPGVTTVIGILDKPALVGWAANTTAAYAIEHWARLAEMPIPERLKALEKARYSGNRAATQKGHRIHNMAEAMQHGKPVDCPPELVPDVQAIARLLDQWQAESVAIEAPIASTRYGYAGTLDVVAKCPKLGTAVWDFKTGKGVYRETALQLGAYARADLILTSEEVVGPRGGISTQYVEGPMVPLDQIETGYVVHARDGQASLLPVTIDADVFRAFLATLELFYDWERRTGWDYRSHDDYRPVIHEAIWPETTVHPDTADQLPPF
jgi:hypothetical protein